ncbi:MAG: hypothetical protein KDI62_08190 [Anaerolineae bacterium]|nr:hypothetical protein [Anaerolineae bacterium]MCB9109108.1 hypothetical protein [Anaerolineales bacterium]
MSDKTQDQPKFDPLAMWKEWQTASLNAWAKSMSETVASEDFAQSMGQSLTNYLETSAPVREQVEKAMEQYLQQMNMPTRQEVVSIAERLTNMEMRIDDLDAKVDQILEKLEKIITKKEL